MARPGELSVAPPAVGRGCRPVLTCADTSFRARSRSRPWLPSWWSRAARRATPSRPRPAPTGSCSPPPLPSGRSSGRCARFRAIYASSAIGSFLDTVLPGRLGEAAKVGVLRAASANRWPGLPRAGGSLLAAHLTEAIAFCLVGATAGVFLPVPGWVRGALLGAVTLAAGGIVAAALLHHRLGRRLPKWA